MKNISSLLTEERVSFLKKHLPLEIGIAVALVALIAAVIVSLPCARENLSKLFPSDSVICAVADIDRLRTNPAMAELFRDVEQELYRKAGFHQKEAKYFKHLISYYWIKAEDVSQIAWSMNEEQKFFLCGNFSSGLTARFQKLLQDISLFFSCMKSEEFRKTEDNTYMLKNEFVLNFRKNGVVSLKNDLLEEKHKHTGKSAQEALALTRGFLKADPVFWITGKIPASWHNANAAEDFTPAGFVAAGYYTGSGNSLLQLDSCIFCTDELQAAHMQVKILDGLYGKLREKTGKDNEMAAFIAKNLQSQKNGTVLTYSLVIPADYLIAVCRDEFQIRKYRRTR